jgi:hypothetical protein
MSQRSARATAPGQGDGGRWQGVHVPAQAAGPGQAPLTAGAAPTAHAAARTWQQQQQRACRSLAPVPPTTNDESKACANSALRPPLPSRQPSSTPNAYLLNTSIVNLQGPCVGQGAGPTVLGLVAGPVGPRQAPRSWRWWQALWAKGQAPRSWGWWQALWAQGRRRQGATSPWVRCAAALLCRPERICALWSAATACLPRWRTHMFSVCCTSRV